MEMDCGLFAAGRLSPQDAGKSEMGDELHATAIPVLETGSSEAIDAMEFLLRNLWEQLETRSKGRSDNVPRQWWPPESRRQARA
jgi:hypothetical protein